MSEAQFWALLGAILIGTSLSKEWKITLGFGFLAAAILFKVGLL